MFNTLRSLLLQFERRLSRAHKEAVILCLDAALVPLCFLLTNPLVYGLLWPHAQLSRLAILFPLLAILGAAASLAVGLPRIKLKSFTSFSPVGVLPFAIIIALGTFCLTMMPGLTFPVVGTISFAMAVLLAVVCARVAMLTILLWVLATDRPLVRVLIYGAGQTGQQLASALQSHETISVIAFIDDDPSLHTHRLMGRKIYSSAQIADLAQRYRITRVLLAMPSLADTKLAQKSRSLQALGLDVQALPSFAQLVGTEKLVQHLTSVPPIRYLGRKPLDEDLTTGPSTYAGCVVLISGAGGSVGSELCRQIFAHQPAKLVLYEVSELALYQIERELRDLLESSGAAEQVELVPVLGSVTDARLTRAVLSQHKVDTVFHAAAYKHVPLVESNPSAGIANNVFGTRVLADACSELGVKRFILISSDKAVRPSSVMGASKRLAELVVQDRSKRSATTHFAIVRFGNVMGSSGSVIPLFREQIARGGPVTLTHDDVTRYFMTIAEASKLVLMAGSFAVGRDNRGIAVASADVFVLDMGEPVRIRQLAEQMIQAAGCTVRDVHNPNGDIEIRVIGLRPGEKLYEELLIGQSLLNTPHPKITCAAEESLSELEMALAMRELAGFVATGDAEALRSYVMGLVRPQGTAHRGKAAAAAT